MASIRETAAKWIESHPDHKVIPLGSKAVPETAKRPMTKTWLITDDPMNDGNDQVWDMASGYGIIADEKYLWVDIDRAKGIPDPIMKAIKEHPTWEAKTPRLGGRRLLYRNPEEVSGKFQFGDNGADGDIRAGTAYYVLGPGSLHPSGDVYDYPECVDIVDAPEMVVGTLRRDAPVLRVITGETHPWETEWNYPIPSGNHDNYLARFCAHMAGLYAYDGVDKAGVEDLVYKDWKERVNDPEYITGVDPKEAIHQEGL